MLRVQLEIDGEVRREWPIEDNDYQIRLDTATITSTAFIVGKEHCYHFDGTASSQFVFTQIDDDGVYDMCSENSTKTGAITTRLGLLTQNTAGDTYFLTYSGFTTCTARNTYVTTESVKQDCPTFAITKGYTP